MANYVTGVFQFENMELEENLNIPEILLSIHLDILFKTLRRWESWSETENISCNFNPYLTVNFF